MIKYDLLEDYKLFYKLLHLPSPVSSFEELSYITRYYSEGGLSSEEEGRKDTEALFSNPFYPDGWVGALRNLQKVRYLSGVQLDYSLKYNILSVVEGWEDRGGLGGKDKMKPRGMGFLVDEGRTKRNKSRKVVNVEEKGKRGGRSVYGLLEIIEPCLGKRIIEQNDRIEKVVGCALSRLEWHVPSINVETKEKEVQIQSNMQTADFGNVNPEEEMVDWFFDKQQVFCDNQSEGRNFGMQTSDDFDVFRFVQTLRRPQDQDTQTYFDFQSDNIRNN